MAEFLYRLGIRSARSPWTVIGSWLAILLLGGGGFAIGFAGLATSFDIPGLPSSEVVAELEGALPEYAGASGGVVFRTVDGTPLSERQRAAITELATGLSESPDVARVFDPFRMEQERVAGRAQVTGGAQFISAGRARSDAEQAQLDADLARVRSERTGLEARLARTGDPSGSLRDRLGALTAEETDVDAGLARLAATRTGLDRQAAMLADGTAILALAEPIRAVSTDGSTAVVTVSFTEPRLELADSSKRAIIDYVDAHPIEGVEVGISGEIAQGMPAIFGVAEVVGIAFAAIVLGVVLRTLAGAAIPLVSATVGVAVALLVALSFSGVVQMMMTTPILAIMLGLAVGIDYSLFVVNRHRRQVRSGTDLVESIGLANGTSGNAVVFAGATVIIALLALNVIGIPFLGLMGTVGAFAVVVAVLLAVTLTPALLGLAGRRVIGRGGSGEDRTVAPIAPMRNRRAVGTVVGVAVVLLLVAAPLLDMRVGLPDGSTEPVGSHAQRAYVITEAEFGAGANSPLLVTAELPADLDDAGELAAQRRVAAAIAEVDGVVGVAAVAVAKTGGLAAFQVLPGGGPNSDVTAHVVRELRAQEAIDGAISLGVAGQAAIDIDISERLAQVLPRYLAVIIGLSLLIMIMVFRSLLVPLVATAGFVLSLAATYGALVAVFQWGWGSAIIGLETPGPVLNFLPIILVGFLFGLAMDYQLFLASGMREALVRGALARVAVMQGLRAGRAVVSAAALIMALVFGSFVFAESGIIRSIGFGLAVGILFDAFAIRMLLMPALLHLLGESAWKLPARLDRLIPNVDVEGAALERRRIAVAD
ncbi:MMPL family transporter [Nocardia sp. NPDC058480]|uniref:MMPL family transporter n=1 Tax=Nocardia sp. NPDC058480 TaxID=3346522 RepID=UPI00364FADC0